MGDWDTPKWIYFGPLPTPPKTLVRRVLLFSETTQAKGRQLETPRQVWHLPCLASQAVHSGVHCPHCIADRQPIETDKDRAGAYRHDPRHQVFSGSVGVDRSLSTPLSAACPRAACQHHSLYSTAPHRVLDTCSPVFLRSPTVLKERGARVRVDLLATMHRRGR